MSLYGLDILVEETDKQHFWIGEINGINSGMRGFKQVYGDDRVRAKVKDMLTDRYGRIQVLTSNCPYLEDGKSTNRRTGFNNRGLRGLLSLAQEEKIHWLEEWINYRLNYRFRSSQLRGSILELFPFYDGTANAVINMIPEKVPATPINPWVAQEITQNKLLQYFLLKHTDLAPHFPLTVLTGFSELHDKKELEQLLALPATTYIVKPISGAQGIGVCTFSKQDIHHLMIMADSIAGPFEKDLEKGDYTFETFVGILQPFITTKRFVKKLGKNGYGSIRAIVCNGEFVDAYVRISKERVANLARNAEACPVPKNLLEQLAPFCERVIKTFEEQAAFYILDTYRQELYRPLVERREKPIKSVNGLDVIIKLIRNWNCASEAAGTKVWTTVLEKNQKLSD